MHLIKRDNQAFLSSCLYITRCDADKTADQNMHTSESILPLEMGIDCAQYTFKTSAMIKILRC